MARCRSLPVLPPTVASDHRNRDVVEEAFHITNRERVSVTDLAYALAAHTHGFAVVPPAEDGTKRPAGTWKAYQDHRPDEAQIRSWYEHDRAGFGVLCGAASGHLEMFEVEGRAMDLWRDFRHACDNAGCGDVLRRVIDGYAELTPSGGIHLLWRCPDGVEGNLKLARRPSTTDELEQDPQNKIQVLIETRGEGGYTILAPSCGTVHPTGKAWTLHKGGLKQVAVITGDERAALLKVARSFDRLDPAPPVVTAERFFNVASGDSVFDRVVDQFNRSTTWDEVLTGWHRLTTDAKAITYWVRPGKNPRDGHSATTNALGTDRLIVFSSAVDGFEAYTGIDKATSYDRFSVYAILNHAGDRTAAFRRLRSDDPPFNLGDLAGKDPDAAQEAAHKIASEADTRPASLIVWTDPWDEGTGDWLLEPFLARNRGHALYAGQKAGKSLLCASILIPAALGQAVLGRPAGEPLRTLYLDFEMTRMDIFERVHAMGFDQDTHGASLEPIAYHVLPSLPPLDTAEGGEMVLAWAIEHRAELVVIDTLARAVAGGENDADTYRAYYRHTGAVLKAANIASLRLDHSGKDADKGQRGSSAKADDVDVVWRLTAREENRFTVEATHRRLNWMQPRVELVRVDEPLRYTVTSGTWPAGTKETADVLDDLDAPLDVTVRGAAKLLREADYPARTNVVRAAVKYRREDGKHLGKHFILQHGEHFAETLEKTPPTSGKRGGERPETNEQSSGNTVPPLRGHAFPRPTADTDFEEPPTPTKSKPKYPTGVETDF